MTEANTIYKICNLYSSKLFESCCTLSDDWILSGQGSDGKRFTQETCPRRVIFMGMMNDVPITSVPPKDEYEKFLQECRMLQVMGPSALQFHRTSF